MVAFGAGHSPRPDAHADEAVPMDDLLRAINRAFVDMRAKSRQIMMLRHDSDVSQH